MGIIAYPHPDWCDPRLCTTRPEGTEHRAAPLVSTVCGHRVTVGRIRHDETLFSGEQLCGADEVHVYAENEHSVTVNGDLLAVDMYLSLAEARDLQSMIGTVVETIAAGYQVTGR